MSNEKQRRAKIQKLRQSLKRIRKGQSSENKAQREKSWFGRLKARLGLDNTESKS
jgi:tRNA/tmRNA/rRNA uracil-C5-methylase (TrmA/RlmC/RlmD family)